MLKGQQYINFFEIAFNVISRLPAKRKRLYIRNVQYLTKKNGKQDVKWTGHSPRRLSVIAHFLNRLEIIISTSECANRQRLEKAKTFRDDSISYMSI